MGPGPRGQLPGQSLAHGRGSGNTEEGLAGLLLSPAQTVPFQCPVKGYQILMGIRPDPASSQCHPCTSCPAPAQAEGGHVGAQTVCGAHQWRRLRAAPQRGKGGWWPANSPTHFEQMVVSQGGLALPSAEAPSNPKQRGQNEHLLGPPNAT